MKNVRKKSFQARAMEFFGYYSMDFTQQDLKSKYRQFLLSLHPDVNNSPDASEKTIQLKEYYNLLFNLCNNPTYQAARKRSEKIKEKNRGSTDICVIKPKRGRRPKVIAPFEKLDGFIFYDDISRKHEICGILLKAKNLTANHQYFYTTSDGYLVRRNFLKPINGKQKENKYEDQICDFTGSIDFYSEYNQDINVKFKDGRVKTISVTKKIYAEK